MTAVIVTLYFSIFGFYLVTRSPTVGLWGLMLATPLAYLAGVVLEVIVPYMLPLPLLLGAFNYLLIRNATNQSLAKIDVHVLVERLWIPIDAIGNALLRRVHDCEDDASTMIIATNDWLKDCMKADGHTCS
jgi:hypothetical protein